MKRRALALCASLLLVGLVPGSTLAIPTSNLDQHNDPAMPLTQGMAATDLAQTFTAGKSGLLSGVDLYIIWEGPPGASMTVSIEATTSGLPTGPALASASSAVSSPAGWVHFSFPTPLSVVKDTVYAIVFPTGLSGAWYGSTDTYPGGQAFMKASPASPWDTLADPADFAFRTYVDTVGTQLLWDKPQITAGTSTPLTLTATMTYVNGVEATHYGAFLGPPVPTWFTPTGITCSDTANVIVQADCTLLNFGSGFGSLIPGSATGDILTFTVTGTAAPASSDVGTPGTAMANACIYYLALTSCGDAFAAVDVVAAATPAPPTAAPPTAAPPTAAPPTVAPTPTPSPTKAATPPPTSTGAGPASDDPGSTLWLLPLALIALFGGLLVLDIRRRRLVS